VNEKPSSSKAPKDEVPKEETVAPEEETVAPLHLDQDLVLLKKGSDDESAQVKEVNPKKKKAQQKKHVIPASEWFQG